MSNKNYTRYSKMSSEEPMLVDKVEAESLPETNLIVDDLIDVVNESASAEITNEVTPAVEPEPKAPVVEPEIRKFGRVRGCTKLNVRSMPNRDAKILAEVAEGAELMIDETESTATFYKVCTECGIDGYCMKQYIKVLS